MKTLNLIKLPVRATLGIITELAYALLIMMAAFLICLIFLL